MNPRSKRTNKIVSPLLILFVGITVAVMPVIETFAAINRTSYQYGVTSCTEGSDLQRERCKDQSAEAMAYRIHKGIKGTSPTNPLYSTWVANFKNGTANSKPIDLAILVAETTTSNNQTYLVDLYQNFLCKTANQEAVAIAQWKSQLDGNKQTRAQIALHLAKRPAAMDCMRAGFLDFLETNPPVDPTLADISITCTTQAGQSCTVAAPQYCLSAFVTQPANGTSTITGGNIVYTPNGNSTVEENYAHLRQNGAATAKCNVKVVFSTNPTLDDVSVTCTTQVGESCTVAAPQYCTSTLTTQPANGTSTVTGGNIVYTPSGNSTVEENYVHSRVNGGQTASCNVKIVFEVVDNGKRLHITFLGVGFEGQPNESYFEDKLPIYRQVISEADPFNLYLNKIVFHDISAPVSSGIGCSGGFSGQLGGSRSISCNYPTIDSFLASNGVPADKVIVVVNSGTYGGSATGGGAPVYADGSVFGNVGLGGGRFAQFNIGVEENPTYGNTPYGMVMLHELGHTMGLADEYIEAGSSPTPNPSYRVGQCMPMDPGPNWREPIPFSLTWWDEFADTREYSTDPAARTNWSQGCQYTNDWWRPAPNSIMTGNTTFTFNDISANIMEQMIKSYID